MKAKDGDVIYVSDSRWWLGGLRSYHVKVKTKTSLSDSEVAMSQATFDEAYLLPQKTLVAEKII